MRISDWSSDVCSSDLLGHGLHMSLRNKHRIIAEAHGPARWPGERTAALTLINRVLAVRPGERQHAMKGRAAIGAGADLLQHPFDLAHGHVPVAPRLAFEPLAFGPVGGIKIGRAHVRTPVTNAPLVYRLPLEK